MKKTYCLLIIGLLSFNSYSQNEELYNRLSVLINDGIFYYKVGNYSITSQTLNYNFDSKGLKKVYRKFGVNKSDEKIKEDSLNVRAIYVYNQYQISKIFTEYISTYFTENINRGITVIQFTSNKKQDKLFEQKLVNSILDYSIPKQNYVSMNTDSLNFAGRKLYLGGNCHWRNINSVLCPYRGQINWSVHRTLEDAKLSNDTQYEITKNGKLGKILNENFVTVDFEGIETSAKKIIYDIKGINSLLVGMSGAKTLTIYYVVVKVRGNYINCVLSHWDNDEINKSGLPTLHEEVMVLK